MTETNLNKSSVIQLRLDGNLKKEADALFAELGLDTSTAIRIFLKKAVSRQGMPFDVAIDSPNPITIAALQEAEALSSDPAAKKYKDFAEVLAEVKNEL